MAMPSAQANADPSKAIGLALQRALAFPLSRATGLLVASEKAQEWAQQEASFATIPIDENGMSGGMTFNLMQPVRALLSDWRQARAEFDTLLQPKMASLNAVHQAESELAEAEQQRSEELAGIEKKLESNPDYVNKRDAKLMHPLISVKQLSMEKNRMI